MANTPILAAEYFAGTSRGNGAKASLRLTRIAFGRRDILIEFDVANKREARKLASAHAATPWNF